MIRRCLLLLSLLPLTSFAADLYAPGTAADPRVRTAHYLDRDDRHFSALVELRLLDPADDPGRMPAEYQWRLAENYLAFGMRDRAEAVYRQLAAASADPLLIARARLRLAEFEYERGYLAEARATLYRMRESLPSTVIEDWQDLLSRVLLAEGRYSEAVEVISDLDNARKQSFYTRYNLAVALINDGRAPQGQTVLDRVGRMTPTTKEELALRDRANLSLGWHFLQSQQGGTAKPVFSRVRVEGPFSNRALLGLGWAELAPQGARVLRAEVGDEAQTEASPFSTFSTLGVLLRPGFMEDDVFKRAGLRNFRFSKVKQGEEEALRKALVPWVELISRDPMDPAVLEAWLAIPFSLDRLGAHTQALQYYEKAVETLEVSRKRMDEAIVSIRQGRMVETIVRREVDSEAGWDWKLLDLPDAPETYFLQSLLAEHRFQEALKNYRDLRLMSRNLDTWEQRLNTIETQLSDDKRPAPAAGDLLARARQDWVEPWRGLKIRLRNETSLAAPGSYQQSLVPPSSTMAELTLAPLPEKFVGGYESAQKLRARLANLRGLVSNASDEQSRLLQAMATKELEGQKKQIERYLVEARFALARLYDRQRKGELAE
jgi:tetratricopeptide (TPR) repeat protein